MPAPVRVFVSYSHKDSAYLAEGSLLGFLRGLETEGVEFWTDLHLVGGELWDGVIQRELEKADIVLALVSQAFLDSPYCTQVEIRQALARKALIFPVILSACEWRRHDWLKERHFLPGGDRTIKRHYARAGVREELFLQIRKHLRTLVERARPASRAAPGASANPFSHVMAIREPSRFVGRQAEMRQLRNLLSGGSAVVLGEPKIGKSSLLWQVAGSWSGDVVGPIDFHGIDDLEDFYATLGRHLEVEASTWRLLRDHLREREVLLLLDEVGAGPERGFGREALARFRAICELNRGFRMVVASRKPLREVFPDAGHDSPGFNLLLPIQLGELAAQEARELLAHRWQPVDPGLEEKVIAEILDVAQTRHPFRLQRAAYHRWEALADPGYDWRQALKDDLEHLL